VGVTAVVFDVGETLVDETRNWEAVADGCGARHNDVVPALAAGLRAVHIRRGPWGHVQEPPPEAVRIRSLDELPAVLP
jgi:FMN phosphatase YigB (HAD superfamily)